MNIKNNKPNQNNMNVIFNMSIEQKLKCFKLRTTAPQHTPTMRPQDYSKLPTYQWAKNIYLDKNDQAVPYNYKLLQENKIFKKVVDYHPYQKEWKKYNNHELQQINCGVPCGKLNNITVVDLDFYKDGEEDGNINLFNQEFGSDYNVFNTYTVRTGSGGWHLYFKFNPLIKQTADKDTNVDIRSTGGYVVAAGTHFTTDTGEERAYTVENDCPIATMPENLEQWLLNNLYNKKVSKKRNPIIKVINPITKLEEEIEYDKVDLGVYKFTLTDDEIETYFCKGLPDYFFNDREHHIKFATGMKTLNKYDLFIKWSLKRCYQNKEYELYEATEDFLKVVWNYIVKHNELFCLEHLGIQSETEGANAVLSYSKFKPTECHKEQATINIDRNKLGIRDGEQVDFIEEFADDNECFVIGSDTGTGKTTSMKNHLKKNNKPFISTVSRISLGKEQNKVFNKAGIDCKYWREIQDYLEKINEKRHWNDQLKWDSVEGKNICITIDSLCKLSAFENYEGYTVYLDEFNSLVEYFINCGNMSNKRLAVYTLFRKILKQCDFIVCSDADISDNSLLLLKNWGIKYTYINNNYKHNAGIKATEINNFDDFMEKLNKAPKFMCCCDSKTMVDIVARLNKKCKVYTSDHTGDINLDDDDCVIFSPKIVYGLDSIKTRPVFCYYKCKTITPAAMVQQICRNRNITELYFHFEQFGKMVSPYKYETIEDAKNDIISRDKYGEDLFRAVDKEMADEYINLLAGFEYNFDCYNTNVFGHFLNIIQSRGFLVVTNPQQTEYSPKLKELTMEMRTAKASDINKLCKGYNSKMLLENKEYIDDYNKEINKYEFLTELPFAPEICYEKLEQNKVWLKLYNTFDYDEEMPPTDHFPEWMIKKNEILKIPYTDITKKVTLFTDPNALPKHISVCDMLFNSEFTNAQEITQKDDFNAQKTTSDKSKVMLCKKFKNMIGLKNEFLETPLDGKGFIDESVIKPLDQKTYGYFIKEYSTVFRYRGKEFLDLTNAHECLIFYAKMVNSLCGSSLLIKERIQKKDTKHSCKYKFNIETIKNHQDLLLLRKIRFDTKPYDKYYEEHTPIHKSVGIAQKQKYITTIKKLRK
jgi:hypothetical protein